MSSWTVGVGNLYGTVDVELPEDYTEEQVRDAVWDAIAAGKLKVEDFEVGDAR